MIIRISIPSISVFLKTTLCGLLSLFISANLCYSQVESQQLDELITEYYNSGKFNGSVLVAQDGKVVYKKGIGMANMEWDIPNQPKTKHRIGSVTKQFTALLILQLAEAGKLDLQAPITDYLTDYPESQGSKITTHHLLTHTSGIPNYTALPGFFADQSRNPYTPEEFIKTFENLDLEFTPGEKFSYSNSGYFLLGAIIEKLSSKTYAQMLEEKIFAPVGMKDTGYDNHRDIIKNRATGYEKNGGKNFNSSYLDMSIPYAAGSMYSTVEDLFLWDQALYTNKLLSQKYMALYFKPQIPAYGNFHYAYGWGVGKEPIGNSTDSIAVQAHGGGINGFTANISRSISDRSMVVLLNNTGGAPLNKMTKAIRGIMNNRPYDLPKKSLATAVLDIIHNKGLQEGLNYYAANKDSDLMELDESDMNQVGYQLMQEGKKKAAAAIFKLNVDAFPESFNVYDSYAEVLNSLGDTKGAIANYKTSVEMNPANKNGIDMLKKLGVDTNELEADFVVSEGDLEDYIGRYELAPTFIITVTKEGSQLKAQATGQPMFDIYPKSDDVFYLKVVTAQITFNRDTNGEVESLTLFQNGNKKTGKKLEEDSDSGDKTVIVAEEVLESYVGEYQLNPSFLITISRDGSQLKAQATGQAKFDVFPKSNEVFYFKVVEAQITFNESSKGEVESLTLFQNGVNQTAKRKTN